MSNIKKAVALLLCDTIRRENSGKWYTFAGLTCWSCIRFSKGNLAKIHLRKKKGYRGCRLVNDWHAKLSGSRAKKRILKIYWPGTMLHYFNSLPYTHDLPPTKEPSYDASKITTKKKVVRCSRVTLQSKSSVNWESTTRHRRHWKCMAQVE